MSVRVRFAPSPTGHLHIGGLRTALFNYLFAKNNNGKFLLRVEDTDRKRSTDEYMKSQLDALSWAGITPDEEYFKQSDRLAIYQSFLDKLIAEGKAYRSYTTAEQAKERAERMRSLYGEAEAASYDDVEGDSWVIRFKVDDIGSTISFHDEIRGEVSFAREYFDDFIIARADGTPMYNFVVVVDDILMKITHIIRGEDHISNTPKQILLYKALGADVPVFAHIPLILNKEGGRLSKRDGATSVQSYRDLGYLPDALCNYLVRLGWSCGDQEIFSRADLIKIFKIADIGKKGSCFDIQKLNWVNETYLKSLNPEILIRQIDSLTPNWSSRYQDLALAQAINLYKERSTTLLQLRDHIDVLFAGPISIEHLDLTETDLGILQSLVAELAKTIWDKDNLDKCIKQFLEYNNLKMPMLGRPLRIALVGTPNAPAIIDLLLVLGKEQVIKRLNS
jgi:glutamyl-tRNA synthetase